MSLEITLPVWMRGLHATRLKAAALAWFNELAGWAQWPLSQLDPDTCGLGILNLIAWQRDIDRFDGEPLSLYRLRVKHAYINAVDAGSVAGFKRIFQRLGIGDVEIDERIDGLDWDIVRIRMSDSQLAGYQDLMGVLIRQYGRTCRRYYLTVVSTIALGIHVNEFGNDYQTI